MKVTRFDPGAELVIVAARVWGLHGDKRLSLALDTASSETQITPDILDDLGYSPRHGERITVIRSAVGSERGYLTRVSRLAALGFSCSDFRVNVLDLPDGFGIDGLLGLSFLKQLNVELRFGEGRILVQRIDSSASG